MKRLLFVAAATMFAGRTASAQCPSRPADSGGYNGYVYAPETPQSLAGENVRVHYVIAGTHAAAQADVQFVSDTAEDAVKRFAEMGFAKPPSDESCGATNGGDGKLDIYLVKFAGADGATAKTACSSGKCSSFMLVESTFKGRGYPTTNEGFRTVVVHELFHAVQNAYVADMTERFWAEGTAQWAMKQLHPDLADFERQLPAFFNDPKRSIDSGASGVTAGYLYGSSVWPLFLSLRHGPTTVKDVFERQRNGEDAVPAIDALLKEKGSSLADEFPLFWAWNAGTKDRVGTGGYPDAVKYPGVKTIGVLEDGVSGITSGLSAFLFSGDLGGRMKVSLAEGAETGETRNSGVLVPLDGEKTQLDKAQTLPAVAEGPVLVVVTGITTKKTDAPFTVHVTPDEGPTPSPASSSSGSSSGDDGGCACSTRSSHMDGTLGVLLAVGFVLTRRGRARVESASHE